MQKMQKKCKTVISLVIPVFCNEGSLKRTYEEVKEQCLSADCDFEFIFMNDGSTDASQEVLNQLHLQDDRVRVVEFTRNFGQMAGLLAGMERASGDCTIVMSADLQEPATLIPQMVNSWRNGAEIVIANRVGREDPVVAKLQSAVAYWMLRHSLPEIPKGGFDFVLIGKRALDTFNSIDNRNRFFQGDLLWMGYPIAILPYKRQKRIHGKSSYTFWKKFKNFLDALLVSSYLPIRFISFMGALFSFIGVIYGISVIVDWYLGNAPFDGWAPLMILNLLIGGFVTLMLGLLGEYIWRIHDELRKRPNYVVKNDTHQRIR